MLDDLQHLWRKDRMLLSIVAITLVLSPAIFLYQMLLGYQQQVDVAEKTTRNTAVMLNAELGATLRRVEGTLQELVQQTPSAALHEAAVPQHTRQLVGTLDANLYKFRELNGLGITDADGNLLYTSTGATSLPRDAAGLPYSRHLRAAPVGQLVFTGGVLEQAAQRRIIVVANPIRDHEGRLRGSVYALLDIDRFEELFRPLNLGRDAIVELRRTDDRAVLVRWPAMPKANEQAGDTARPVPASPTADLARNPTTIRQVDAVDGIERIHTIHPLDGYPWLLDVALSRDQALAEWRTRMWLVGALMILFLSLVLLALARFRRMHKDQLRTLRSLGQSEQRFRQFFEKNQSVMLWIDPTDTRIVDANQAAVAYYGYPAERLIGMPIHEINILPEAEIAARMRERRGNGVSRLEFRHRLADGTVRDVEVYTTTLDFSGKPLLYSIIHDITERRLAEHALRTERDHSRLYLDAVETVIVALDTQGNIVSINRKGCQLLGRSAAELIGQCWSTLAHRDADASASRERLRRVMAGEQPLAEYYESMIQPATGPAVQIAWHNALMLDDQGHTTGLLIAGTDITERKRIEDELAGYRRSLEQQVAQRTAELDRLTRRLTLATRAANIGVWEWELDSDQIYWNEQMSLIYGVAHEPVLPAPQRTRQVHPDDMSYVANNMQAILHSNGDGDAGEAGEFRIFRPDGEIRHLFSTGTVVRNEQGKVVRAVGINLDITERKRVENELREARDTAEASDHAKSAFLANVTHELRTPLNAVIGLTNLASDLCVDARQRDYLNKILLSGKHLNRLINDLLDLTKIAAGHLDIESLPFSPSAMVIRCNSVMSHRAAAKGLTLRETIADDVPSLLLGDPLRIEQILLNLVGNAIKFTSAGQVEVRIAAFAREGERIGLQIAVQDSGIGMSPSDVDRLFKPFSQADATISRRFGGSGLGLAISKRLAELMDGDITVTSAPGIGSTFTVKLWLRQADPASAPQLVAEPLGDKADDIHYHNAQVLVVEDQPLNREIVEALLTDVGITVATAENGQEALYILKKSGPETFDAVLMDIQMPIMDGRTTTRELRRWAGFDKLPVIAMTAHTMAHEKEEALTAGMNDHIGKPFDNAQFLGTLAKWISRAKQTPKAAGERRPAEAVAAPPAAAPAAAPHDIRRLDTVPGLDWQNGLSHFNGREDRYRHWLGEFAATSGSTVASLRAKTDVGDYAAAGALAHGLKGRVGMLGMGSLHQQVAALELVLHEGHCDAPALTVLEAAIAQTRQCLEAALAPEPAAAPGRAELAAPTWNEALSVGVPLLDDQHRELFDIANELAARHAAQLRGEDVAAQANELLARLIGRIERHCASEEAYLRTLGYPGLAEHAKQHAALLATLRARTVTGCKDADDIRSARQMLLQYLGQHVQNPDAQYRRYIEECNLYF